MEVQIPMEVSENIVSVGGPMLSMEQSETNKFRVYCLCKSLDYPPLVRVLALHDPIADSQDLIRRYFPFVFTKTEVNHHHESPEDYAKAIIPLLVKLLRVNLPLRYRDAKWVQEEQYGKESLTLVLSVSLLISEGELISMNPAEDSVEFSLLDPDKDFQSLPKGTFSFRHHIEAFLERHSLGKVNKSPKLSLNPYECFDVGGH